MGDDLPKDFDLVVVGTGESSILIEKQQLMTLFRSYGVDNCGCGESNRKDGASFGPE